MAILTPAPINFKQQIRSELAEALRLNYGNIFPTALHLRVTLGSGGVSGAAVLPSPGVDTYRSPGDYALVVGEIRAHIAINTPSAETTAGGFKTGLLSVNAMQDRVIAKAMNARVSLVNADRDNLKLVESDIANSANPLGVFGSMALSTLMPVAGGSPLRLITDSDVMPYLLPANERLRLTVQLRDAETGLGETEYGLVLLGAFVRSRGA